MDKIFRFCKKNIFLILITIISINLNCFSQELYWENPTKISVSNSVFPSVVQNQNDFCIFWQEVDSKKEELWISARYYDENRWQTNSRFAGPYKFSGEVPDIYSATISNKGVIALAVLSSTDTISVFTSSDLGKSFSKTNISVLFGFSSFNFSTSESVI